MSRHDFVPGSGTTGLTRAELDAKRAARRAAIVAHYAESKSMDRTAAHFGISRERVSQICEREQAPRQRRGRPKKPRPAPLTNSLTSATAAAA